MGDEHRVQGFSSTLIIRFVSAEPAHIVSELANYGVVVNHFELIDDITALITVRRAFKKSLEVFFTSKGIPFDVVHQKGIAWDILKLLKRPVLVCGFLLFIAISIFLPNRILFVCVEGNESIKPSEILSLAEEIGVHFGAYSKSVRSERVKNHLLERIPGLQWAGVNISGCVATISVKERETVDHSNQSSDVYSVVAARDGVIREMIVYSGKPLCSVGQTVREGQILVSGFEDCGRFIRTMSADAEIFADTIRGIMMKSPLDWYVNGEMTTSQKKYSIIFGKKRINLFKDTGISDTSCVKMYKQYYINLPGDFVLPFSVVEYTETFYEPELVHLDDADDFAWLYSFANDYLQSQMLSGSIISKETEISLLDDSCVYYGTYACREIIGQLRSEEIYKKNE